MWDATPEGLTSLARCGKPVFVHRARLRRDLQPPHAVRRQAHGNDGIGPELRDELGWAPADELPRDRGCVKAEARPFRIAEDLADLMDGAQLAIEHSPISASNPNRILAQVPNVLQGVVVPGPRLHRAVRRRHDLKLRPRVHVLRNRG